MVSALASKSEGSGFDSSNSYDDTTFQFKQCNYLNKNCLIILFFGKGFLSTIWDITIRANKDFFSPRLESGILYFSF